MLSKDKLEKIANQATEAVGGDLTIDPTSVFEITEALRKIQDAHQQYKGRGRQGANKLLAILDEIFGGKKPIEVELEEFTGKEPHPKGVCFCDYYVQSGGEFRTTLDPAPHVHTAHENQIVFLKPGDIIAPEPDGVHFYPIGEDCLDRFYEEVEELGEEPGALIAEVHCPCCGAELRVEQGDDEGEIGVIGTKGE